MSVCRLGYEVSVLPLTTSASTNVHGPWQITPTGLACSKNPRRKLTASSLPRRLSAPTVPPGTMSASYSSRETSEKVFSTVKVSPGLTSLFMVWASPVWMPMTSTSAPASSTAFLGSVNSTCSLPTGARSIATLRPWSSFAISTFLLNGCLYLCGLYPIATRAKQALSLQKASFPEAKSYSQEPQRASPQPPRLPQDGTRKTPTPRSPLSRTYLEHLVR